MLSVFSSSAICQNSLWFLIPVVNDFENLLNLVISFPYINMNLKRKKNDFQYGISNREVLLYKQQHNANNNNYILVLNLESSCNTQSFLKICSFQIISKKYRDTVRNEKLNFLDSYQEYEIFNNKNEKRIYELISINHVNEETLLKLNFQKFFHFKINPFDDELNDVITILSNKITMFAFSNQMIYYTSNLEMKYLLF